MQKKNKKLIPSLLVIVLAFILMVTSAFAYEPSGYKVYSTLIFTPYRGFTTMSIEHMGQAALKWNAAAGSTLLRISTSTHSVTTGYPSRDGVNRVYRIDVGRDYLAECTTWYTGDRVLESDININVYYAYANSAQPGCYDLYSVFLHETGHTMGLRDLYDESDQLAVMYGIQNTNTMKRNLTRDDTNGIAAIYG